MFPSGTLSAALDDWHVSANISTAKMPSVSFISLTKSLAPAIPEKARQLIQYAQLLGDSAEISAYVLTLTSTLT